MDTNQHGVEDVVLYDLCVQLRRPCGDHGHKQLHHLQPCVSKGRVQCTRGVQHLATSLGRGEGKE